MFVEVRMFEMIANVLDLFTQYRSGSITSRELVDLMQSELDFVKRVILKDGGA
jgi:hypothetical protein